eukprot:2552564-Amphidinium_carterae.1
MIIDIVGSSSSNNLGSNAIVNLARNFAMAYSLPTNRKWLLGKHPGKWTHHLFFKCCWPTWVLPSCEYQPS